MTNLAKEVFRISSYYKISDFKVMFCFINKRIEFMSSKNFYFPKKPF